MKGRKIMLWVLSVLSLFILGIAIWLLIPYSPMKSEFRHLKDNQIAALQPLGQVFTEEDIANLPVPLQKYFKSCGYIGTPKMFNIKIIHSDVDFILNSKALKISCIQYNSSVKPERIAFINTRFYGVPFEGIDAYEKGIGSMKGMIAKSV